MSDASSTATPTPFDAFAVSMAGRQEPRSVRKLPELLRSAVRIARQANPRLFLGVRALQFATIVVLLLQLFFAKLLLERLIEANDGSVDTGAVVLPLVGLLAATAFGTLGGAFQTHLQRLLGEQIQQSMWNSILDVATRVNLETYETPGFFDELQRVQVNAITRPLAVATGLTQLVGGLLGTIALTVALLFVAPLLVPIVLVAGVPLWWLSRRQGRVEFGFSLAETPGQRRRNYLTTILTGREEAKEVRAFGLDRALLERWNASYDRYIDELKGHVRRRIGLDVASAAATLVSTSLALGLLVYLIVDDRLALASAGVALLAVRLLADRTNQLFKGIGSLFESAMFLRDLETFLARGRTLAERPSGDGAQPGPFRSLGVEDLHFTYPGTTREVLRGVSIDLREGEIVALVGENGSGKTTLAKILAQLFTPSAGRVMWNERDTRELDPAALRSEVAVIFQDFIKYALSVHDNVALGKVERSDDEDGVRVAARQAGADPFLSSLPEGYASMLGRMFGGYDLSLGQWQRVALARAFFRDSRFLVLDEPTASLDPRSEADLFDRIRDLAGGRAVLLISHRFSTVRSANRIYVLHEGEIVEQGTHDELVAAAGRYAELFELQASAFN